jgi:hypothetical protein
VPWQPAQGEGSGCRLFGSVRVPQTLHEHVKRHNLGRVFVAPVDVVLDPENTVQPDVVFGSAENSGIIQAALLRRREKQTQFPVLARTGIRPQRDPVIVVLGADFEPLVVSIGPDRSA